MPLFPSEEPPLLHRCQGWGDGVHSCLTHREMWGRPLRAAYPEAPVERLGVTKSQQRTWSLRTLNPEWGMDTHLSFIYYRAGTRENYGNVLQQDLLECPVLVCDLYPSIWPQKLLHILPLNLLFVKLVWAYFCCLQQRNSSWYDSWLYLLFLYYYYYFLTTSRSCLLSFCQLILLLLNAWSS